MAVLVTTSRIRTAVLLFAAIALVGCGGAEMHKARHLAKGQEFLAARNFEKARVEFRNALQIAPNDSEARYENGVIDEKLGNPREAARFYQGAIDSNADNVAARAALGRIYVFGGAPERAIEAIKPALVKHPDDARLLSVRAAARVQLKDPDGALQDAELAVQNAPNSEDAVAVLAGIHQSKHEPEKARILLEGAIKQIPATVDLRLALAQLYASENQPEKVEKLLVDLVQLNPKERSHRLRLAQFYARLNHPDDAERVLREGIKALPDDREIKIALIDFLAARRSRDAAAKELEHMIASNPRDYDLRLAQARFYEQGTEIPQAEAIYAQIMDAAAFDAPGITARDRLALLKVQNSDVPGAKKLLAEVLEKSPRDNDALILRGNLSLAEKDPKAAIADLRSVLRDQPNAIGVMRSLARAHQLNGEPALAEETMRRAVDANPRDASARLDLAQLLTDLGKAQQAKPVIDELVKQEPDNMAALEIQYKVGAAIDDKAEALAAADAMVATHPKVALGYYYQGRVAESEQRLAEAARLYQTALEVQPETVEPLQSLAQVLVRLKRTPEALQRLDAAIAQYPKVAFALNAKGQILLNEQSAADAVAAFKTAIQREPTWWVPYRGLALAQSAQNDAVGGVATLRAGVSAVKQRLPLQLELAAFLERLGKSDEAIQVFDDELKKDPQSDVAANNLAMLLSTYKNDPQSMDRAKALSARFASSTNPEFLDTYGWVLYKHGDSVAALAALHTAVSKSPNSPVLLYHLGMAQASAGQGVAARDSLERSLQSGKNFSGKDQAKAALEKLATAAPSGAPPPKT